MVLALALRKKNRQEAASIVDSIRGKDWSRPGLASSTQLRPRRLFEAVAETGLPCQVPLAPENQVRVSVCSPFSRPTSRLTVRSVHPGLAVGEARQGIRSGHICSGLPFLWVGETRI